MPGPRRNPHPSNGIGPGPPPQGSGRPPQRPGPPGPPPPAWRSWLLLVGLIVTMVLLLAPWSRQQATASYNYTTFVQKIQQGQVRSVTISSDGHVTGTLNDGTRFTSAIPTALPNDTLLKLLADHNVQVKAVGAQSSWTSWLVILLPMLLMIGLFVWIGRRAGAPMAGLGGVGRARAKLYDTQRPQTTFADVAGYQGAKREVTEVVDFLRNPDRYRRAGAMGPKGVLLVGPPGTGKTLIARAVAGEAHVPFLSVTGSSFVEMFVGVGAARVRDLFADARKRAPAIIFIDEIDAIGQRRGGSVISNDEREQTLNQMLAEMDGFDPALLRPGRFDRRVVIPLPTQRERVAILAVHARGKKLGADVDLDVVARGTPGFSGADLANLVNEAAIFAVRGGRDTLSALDFAEARDRILLGRREESNVLLPTEKRAVAVHESGHALVAALATHGDPVAKVTILPAGQALGATEQLPVDERHLYSEGYLKDSLAIRLGGRAAELLVLGEASTGAADDLAGATSLATRMVREFGLSPALGPVGFASGSPMYLGTEQVRTRPYAEATQHIIDREISKLLREAEQDALDQLRAHRDALDRLVALLLERETVDGTDVYRILGRTPGHAEPILSAPRPGDSRSMQPSP